MRISSHNFYLPLILNFGSNGRSFSIMKFYLSKRNCERIFTTQVLSREKEIGTRAMVLH